MHSWGPRLDDLSFDSIGEEEAILLERPFKEDELFEVIRPSALTVLLGVFPNLLGGS